MLAHIRQSRSDSGTHKTVKARFWHIQDKLGQITAYIRQSRPDAGACKIDTARFWYIEDRHGQMLAHKTQRRTDYGVYKKVKARCPPAHQPAGSDQIDDFRYPISWLAEASSPLPTSKLRKFQAWFGSILRDGGPQGQVREACITPRASAGASPRKVWALRSGARVVHLWRSTFHARSGRGDSSSTVIHTCWAVFPPGEKLLEEWKLCNQTRSCHGLGKTQSQTRASLVRQERVFTESFCSWGGLVKTLQ